MITGSTHHHRVPKRGPVPRISHQARERALNTSYRTLEHKNILGGRQTKLADFDNLICHYNYTKNHHPQPFLDVFMTSKLQKYAVATSF